MPLPFLDPKKVASLVVSKKIDKPSVELAAETVVEPEMPELNMIAEDMLAAIDKKSPSDLAKAIHAAFLMCESMPHEEKEMEVE